MKGIRASVEVLSQNEVELIHRSSLKVLEEVGVRVPNSECLDLCEKCGAQVDRDLYNVKIPIKVMEEILSTIRQRHEKNREDAIVRKQGGSISTQVFIVDYKTRKRRYGNMEDVVKGIVLSDRLSNIKASNAVVIPHEVPHNMTDVLSYQAIYKYSTKPGGTYILSPVSAKYIIQMGRVMGTSIGYLLETVSPLQFREESLEMALVFAREGQPIYLAPMVIGGASGPVTIAGTVTLQNTEILASMFLIRALNSDGYNYGSCNHTMDMRTTLCSFGSPNQALLGMAAAQMGRFYGLTAGSNSGLTDALVPDFQGGFEKASSAIFSCLSGAVDIGAQGIVGADQGISFEQMVIDNEWLDAYNYILNGVEVNEDTIAADVMKNVGVGGSFMAEEHTVRHMRTSAWNGRVFNRLSWDASESRGIKDTLERAHEYVLSVMEEHYPPNLAIEESKANEIDLLVKNAEEEMRAKGLI